MKHIRLIKLNPCKEGLDFASQFRTLQAAWNACENSQWMLWYLIYGTKTDKSVFVEIAQNCAKHPNNAWKGYNAAYAYADAATAAAADAAYAAAYAVYVAAHATATAAAAAAAAAAERKWQADMIRSLVPKI